MILHGMIQGFAWISRRAVPAELEFLPRETRGWKVPRSGFICDLLACGKFGGRSDCIGQAAGLLGAQIGGMLPPRQGPHSTQL